MTESDGCFITVANNHMYHCMVCLSRTQWDDFSRRSWRPCEKFQTLRLELPNRRHVLNSKTLIIELGSLVYSIEYNCLVCVCVQRSLSNAEEEVKHQHEMCDRLQTELTDVAEKSDRQSTEFDQLNEKLRVIHPCCCWKTRNLCYRKDNRAMRPIYGCREDFRDSLTTPTAIFTRFFIGYCSDWPCKYAYKIWSP